jgi:hypothetical protein
MSGLDLRQAQGLGQSTGSPASNAAVIIEIKRQCHEKSDFGHSGRSVQKLAATRS